MADKSIDSSMIKELREKTGVGILDCKKALEETDGDMEKAVEFLRKKGLETAKKKSGREASEGIVESYIHSNGKIGVLIEVNCETDFVARTDEFQDLVRDICMHIAATNPVAISPEDIPEEVVEGEREIYRTQMKDKPANIIDNIIEGKLKKFYQEKCLLQQPFVKDPKGKKTVGEVVKAAIAKLGENIEVARFTRYELGEDEEE